MNKYSGYFELITKKEISSSIYKYTFHAKDIAVNTIPGQFIQIKTSESHFPLWPRPFSIHDTDPDKGELSIIFKIIGEGTSSLARKKTGDLIHLFGPLGNGFNLPKSNEDIIMAAGGVGLPPLYMLSKRIINKNNSSQNITFIAGAKTKDELFNSDELSSLDVNLKICTDDGSSGLKGTVVDILENELSLDNKKIVYACGPAIMLRKIDEMICKKNIPGYLSLEQLMPCGYGICSGCAVKTHPPKDREQTDDNRDYRLKRVCREGPVFNSGEVIWE